MSDLNIIKYQLFLTEQMEEDSKLEACINESILMSSGENNLQNIQLLNESVVDKAKEVIKKIAETLGVMWGKFIEAVNVLVKKDQAYLEKYKDIILKKNPVEAEYTMYNYKTGVGNILKSPVPVFNYSSMKDELESKESFINSQYFNRYKLSGEKGTNFIDVSKSYFRGSVEQIKIKSTDLNMTDIYNYCHGYEKMADLIKKDLKYVQDAANNGIRLVEKMGRENKIAQESTNILEADKYYSFLYEQYITEEEAEKKVESKEKTSTTPTREVNSDKPKSQYNGTSGDKKDMEEKDAEGSSAKVTSDKIKIYMNTCADFIAAKQSITEEIYKSYMTIIKTHIRDHVGKKDSDGKPKDSSTNYDNTSKSDNKDEKNNEETNDDSKSKSSKGSDTVNIFKNVFKNKK